MRNGIELTVVVMSSTAAGQSSAAALDSAGVPVMARPMLSPVYWMKGPSTSVQAVYTYWLLWKKRDHLLNDKDTPYE